MTREYVLMVLGALVLLSPWSGLPMAWLEWILLVIGLLIVGIAYTMRKHDEDTQPPAPPRAPLPPHQPEEPRPHSSNIAFS